MVRHTPPLKFEQPDGFPAQPQFVGKQTRLGDRPEPHVQNYNYPPGRIIFCDGAEDLLPAWNKRGKESNAKNLW